MKRPTPLEKKVAQALMRSLSDDRGVITADVLPLVLASYREELIEKFQSSIGTVNVKDMRTGITPYSVRGADNKSLKTFTEDEFYVDVEGSDFGVFGTESGFCYSLWSSREDAEKDAKERTEMKGP